MRLSLIVALTALFLAVTACNRPNSLGYPPAERVEPSVARIVSAACGFESVGTGVFVGENLLVTNAHVVAGSEKLIVRLPDRTHLGGRLVGFDSAVDLALIETEQTPPDVVVAALADDDPVAGDLGMVFVYSNGQNLVSIPYEVRRTIVASGADIYGSGKHFRQALDLDTIIRPGDSGAGLFDHNAAVVGIAFASSRSESDVTYAITASQLRIFLESTNSITEADPGPCLG